MRKLHCGWQALLGMMSLVLVLSLALFVDTFSIVSHAESKGKVTAQSAKIREEASTSSDALGSAAKGDEISIIGKTTGSDGMTWYQIYVNANTKGYIRSDLAEVTDGSTPTTLSSSSTTTTTTTQTTTPVVNETPVAVTEVEPISANVTGGSAVRVRSNASTTSSIVTTAQNGLALTVTGIATGTDNNTWYQVNFIANGTQVVGFIRNDYVVLSGELVVPSDEPAPETADEPDKPAVEETKDWDTQLDGDKWYLVDNAAGKRYVIQDMFNAVEANKTLYEEAQADLKGQKVTVIILVILLVVALGGIALLIFRIKDMLDEAYFEEVEKETYRRRGNSGSSSASAPNRKIMQTVGEEQPARQRQAGQPQGTRPAQRPTGGAPQGARPAQRPTGQPQGARPAGAAPQGARPAQRPAGVAPQGARPGQRPVGQPQGARPAQRPVEQTLEGSRPAQRPVGQAPQAARPVQQPGNGTPNPGWKSKNFMADEDEFEFEFLNWEGDEE